MTLSKPLHVAVLMGGWANERPVSMSSGTGVADALESKGHRVTRIDMGRDVALRLHEAKPDVVCLQELKSPDANFPAAAIREAGYAITFANISTEQGFAIDTFYLTPERGLTRDPHPPEALAEVLRGVVS